MTKRRDADDKALEFFENLWRHGDYWELETSPFEDARYAALFAMLSRHRYRKALELGCGAGAFTQRLVRLTDQILAVDISPAAIARARTSTNTATVEFRVANVMDCGFRDPGGFDLVVLSETIYYLGWLYPFFNVAWLASELFTITSPGGHLLLANTCDGSGEPLLRPWIIRTYRDLFGNVGYRLEQERVFRGDKHGAQLEVLMSLFVKPVSGLPARGAGDSTGTGRSSLSRVSPVRPKRRR